MQNSNLPNGFITIQEAIDLINEDTRSDAKVDTAFLVAGIPYLRVGGTYNIRKMKHVNGRAVYDGERFVLIETEYDRTMLEHAIVEHYKKMSGDMTYDPEKAGLKNLSTAVDDEENPSGRIIRQKKAMTKAGDDITEHATRVTNGQD